MPQISVDRALELAVAHYQAGQWGEAENIYRQIVVHIPDHAIAMHHLAIILAQTNRAEEAIPLLTRVAQLRLDDANVHSDLGSALREMGRSAESAAVLSRAVLLAPGLPLVHNNLSNALRDLGKLDEAITGYHRAIQLKPDYAEAYNNLGNALCDKGTIEEAANAYRRAIELNPGFAPAHSNLGVALEKLHRSEEAVSAFRQAIQLAPNYVEAYSNFGQSLESLERLDEAMSVYQHALKLDPDFAGAHCNMGNLLLNNKKTEEAIAAFRRAIELDPQMALAFNNLGNALSGKGILDDAIAAYRHALQLKPKYVDAMSNLAGTLIDQGKLDEPASLLRRAMEIDPQFPDAHWNLSIFLLLQGDFERGLPEYEWRWKVKNIMRGSPRFSQPPWDGRELNGQTILLYAEQGAGDAIQFVRYLPMVAARGGRIILRCPPELKRLFAQIPNVEKLVDSTEPIPDFDFQCPFLSLPLAFKTRLDSIPATVPYLQADPTLVEGWRNKLSSDKSVRRIGIAWAGASYHKNNRNRSTDLASFAPLADVQNVALYSLQKGEAAAQTTTAAFAQGDRISPLSPSPCTQGEGRGEGSSPSPENMRLPRPFAISDFTSELNDFADTAALIANLDLVIAVDTSVVHLAGAMGKPVWVLLPCNPDWRWMLNRIDSPWYPTMRLFRQAKPDDWAATMSEVARHLRETEKTG